MASRLGLQYKLYAWVTLTSCIKFHVQCLKWKEKAAIFSRLEMPKCTGLFAVSMTGSANRQLP